MRRISLRTLAVDERDGVVTVAPNRPAVDKVAEKKLRILRGASGWSSLTVTRG
jgi:hypothetical protein